MRIRPGLLILFLYFCVGCVTTQAGSSVINVSSPTQKAFIDVNGVTLYYEIYANKSGTPLVLLHGGGSSIHVTYGKILPFFSSKRNVIAIDEQAHGRSGDRNAPVQFETSADDVAAILKELQISKADIMGFSNGASVALQVAIRHPELVRKLVFVSAMTKKSGSPPMFWQNFVGVPDLTTMPKELRDAQLDIELDAKKLKNMHDKDFMRMKNFKDVPDALVKGIKAETLLVAGDQDVVTAEHLVELSKMIKGSKILILPGGHGDFLGEITMAKGESEMPALTAGLINQFLGAP